MKQTQDQDQLERSLEFTKAKNHRNQLMIMLLLSTFPLLRKKDRGKSFGLVSGHSETTFNIDYILVIFLTTCIVVLLVVSNWKKFRLNEPTVNQYYKSHQ